MSKKVSAKPNQSMLDIVLMEYGTLEAGMAVAAANNTSICTPPAAGSELIMPEVDEHALDKDAAGYLKQNRIAIGTLAS